MSGELVCPSAMKSKRLLIEALEAATPEWKGKLQDLLNQPGNSSDHPEKFLGLTGHGKNHEPRKAHMKIPQAFLDKSHPDKRKSYADVGFTKVWNPAVGAATWQLGATDIDQGRGYENFKSMGYAHGRFSQKWWSTVQENYNRFFARDVAKQAGWKITGVTQAPAPKGVPKDQTTVIECVLEVDDGLPG